MTHEVKIICAGENTVARFDRGVWRCARCGKHIQVVLPDRAAAYVTGGLALLALLALLPATATYVLLAVTAPIACLAAFRAGYRMRIPLLDRETSS